MTFSPESFCEFVQGLYSTTDFIPLHAPTLSGNEEKYLVDVIRSTFVSSVGKEVVEFEDSIARSLGVKHAVAMVNGSAALHIALLVAGVEPGTEVLTQALSFVATANAIKYAQANPVFLDVDSMSYSLCPVKLEQWLEQNIQLHNGTPINKNSGARVSACVPMHTFGFIGDINKVIQVCEKYSIPVVEDAAESLGSTKEGRHAGSFGLCSAISFNGNKIITTGGGGMFVTDSDELASLARHLSTTAKKPHKWEYVHDMVGYNYRMPNLNAALGKAQLEQLSGFLSSKRAISEEYRRFFSETNVEFLTEPDGCTSNYWLCTAKFLDKDSRDEFLAVTNGLGVMTRPVWELLNRLPPYSDCQTGDLTVAEDVVDRLVNIPSSVVCSGGQVS